ncbi:MAG: hypothetical protein ACQSGP_28815, partial [Frankia sp.]
GATTGGATTGDPTSGATTGAPGGKRPGRPAAGARGASAVAVDPVEDLRRERELRRAGWRFARVRASRFAADPEATLDRLRAALADAGVEPLATDPATAVRREPARAAAGAGTWAPITLRGLEGLDDDPSPPLPRG